MNRTRLIVAFLLVVFSSYGQKRDYNWVFGDHVGVNFNTNPPSIDTTRIIRTQETSASISDNSGNLLFYVGCLVDNFSSTTTNGFSQYQVRDANNNIMPGGDSLFGSSTVTQGIVILPDSYNSNMYYIVHGNGHKLYYSIVDMSTNNNLGSVVSVNNFLIDSVSEKLQAVRAANGIDWWIATVRSKYCSSNCVSNSKFLLFKLDSLGISYHGDQPCDSTQDFFMGQMIFSPKGNRVALTGTLSYINTGNNNSYLFDFDRCTGEFSNKKLIHSAAPLPIEVNYGCSFSQEGRYFYLSSETRIWQFNVDSPNISSTMQLILTNNQGSNHSYGAHKLGPDGKIYITNHWSFVIGVIQPSDSLNSHMTVIEQPNLPGLLCSPAPFSFSLLGRKHHPGLPAYVNYNLGLLDSVNCDSILALSINENQSSGFTVFPTITNSTITIKSISNYKGTIRLVNLSGETVFKNAFTLQDSQTIDISNSAPGLYLVIIEGDQKIFRQKIILIK